MAGTARHCPCTCDVARVGVMIPVDCGDSERRARWERCGTAHLLPVLVHVMKQTIGYPGQLARSQLGARTPASLRMWVG
eukprot:scaffold6494_cov129-Isochrysis_galbana.AAC.3